MSTMCCSTVATPPRSRRETQLDPLALRQLVPPLCGRQEEQAQRLGTAMALLAAAEETGKELIEEVGNKAERKKDTHAQTDLS